MEKTLTAAAIGVEFIAAVVIAVVALLAVLGAARFIPGAAREILDGSLDAPDITAMISDLMLAFIAIELLRIARAYLNRTNVLPTVIEAGLVALIRQVVLYHPKDHILAVAGGLALLILSLGLLWFLLARVGAMRRHGVEREFDEPAAESAGQATG
jgi:uncharacterized membrane protein (DUF373 family)